MNLKAIKTKTQENITKVIKSMVNEGVNVQAFYDFEKESVTLQGEPSILNKMIIIMEKRTTVATKIRLYMC